jgi:hypothetical protein
MLLKKIIDEVIIVNRVGRYSQNEKLDELELMRMVFELSEKDRMLMWLQGYIDLVISKLPAFAKDILQNRKVKWEDTKEYVKQQLEAIVLQPEFIEASHMSRKEFALFVKEKYPHFQTLLFKYYDGKINDVDFRKFVYHSHFGPKRYLL